jgi:acyl-coenzyme A synthetase/AMP-(fatty) acid ligase
VGRPAFLRFLDGGHRGGGLSGGALPGRGPSAAGRPAAPSPAGVRWGADHATWDDLLRRGRDRARLVREQGCYVVDPAAGVESLASLFAVATVPDTVLLWASAAALGVPHRELAPGLHEIEPPVPGPVERPLWGVCTSGSSGTPKAAIGYADEWELIALHCERALYDGVLPGGPPEVLATCLPLQFSAAFFMTVLPALLLRRDLLVFPAYDWTLAIEAARSRRVLLLAVPALAAAAALGADEPAQMHRAALLLGGGHVSADRVRLVRERWPGIALANLYGTAETGAVALDHDPGHNRHVGFPVPGKAVWVEGADERGVGAVAVAGPGCCRWLWRPGGEATPVTGTVTSTDFGRFDADGHLCLEGRVDGGEKLRGVLVYPRAVERHLLALDGVSDARVLIERSPNGLEHLTARVVGDVDEAAVRDHCTALPETERPSRISCVPERDALSAYSANGKL